jgi:hypothetical protein
MVLLEGVGKGRGEAEGCCLGWGEKHIAVPGLNGVPGGVGDVI